MEEALLRRQSLFHFGLLDNRSLAIGARPILPLIGCIVVPPFFLSVSYLCLGPVVVELYAVPTSSSRAKDVGAWGVGRSEARLSLFKYLALGANSLHCQPYSLRLWCFCVVWLGVPSVFLASTSFLDVSLMALEREN